MGAAARGPGGGRIVLEAAGARSPFASGLAQFTGPTWSDIAPATDPGCADAAPVDPACSLRAQILYMRRLLSRFRRTREPWRFAWAAYNCGPGWVIREQRECAATPDCDPNRWSAHVQTICLRNPANCAETRGYPAKIESKIPRYL